MLDPDVLLRAYAAGIFPMADDRHAEAVFWVEPKKRGILPLERLHISRSLAKTLKSGQFQVTRDQAFGEVVRLCAEAAPDRPTTWINGEIEQAVTALHHRGAAHSIEVWEQRALVGGLYGIRLGRAFFGESMFSRSRDASKVALVHLVDWMKSEGQLLLDCQFITPHLASLGAIEVTRKTYLAHLGAALE
jgi:leucyl/phenylalanyl-tRNA---protein transferase